MFPKRGRKRVGTPWLPASFPTDLYFFETWKETCWAALASRIVKPWLLEFEVVDFEKVSFHRINNFTFLTDPNFFETWKETCCAAIASSIAAPWLLEVENHRVKANWSSGQHITNHSETLLITRGCRWGASLPRPPTRGASPSCTPISIQKTMVRSE